MILLLRALSRALAFVLLTVLALACLAAAGFAIPRSGLATLGDLTHTDTAAGQSRDFLDRLEDGEMPAGAAAGAGLAAVVGLVLVAGAVLPRRERTLPMDDGPEGRVTARRRPLRLAAAALAARPAEVTRSKAGVRGRYRRAGGRLRVCVHRRPEAQDKPLAEQVRGQLEGLTNAFALRTRVRTRRDESRRRLR